MQLVLDGGGAACRRYLRIYRLSLIMIGLPIHKNLFDVFQKGLWQFEKCVSSSESSKKHEKI